MINLKEIIVPVFALTALCIGWVMVQLLAKKMGTKNHLDRKPGCGGCNCGGGVCERDEVVERPA